VTASLGPLRPKDLPQPEVAVSLSGVPLGHFTPAASWTTQAFTLPRPLPDGPPVLRLDVLDPVRGRPLTWRPANVLPGSDDTRDLGVMVDRVRVVSGDRDRSEALAKRSAAHSD
jgi:hypothetical protein